MTDTPKPPPLYRYFQGQPYLLATHAAAQMERVILAVRGKRGHRAPLQPFGVAIEPETIKIVERTP